MLYRLTMYAVGKILLLGIICTFYTFVHLYPTQKIVHEYKVSRVNYALADAVKTDVTYQLFTNRSTYGIYINEESAVKLIDSHIPTKFVIHGWLSNETTYWYAPYRDECFKKGNYNIIYVDWSKAGAKNFFVSAANSKPIGKFIGDFIVDTKLKLNNVHVIGHSLGSHVAGFIGKRVFERTSRNISRITCNDPAGPSFEDPHLSENDRVSRSDADFVDVIHSDIGHYGFINPIGHVDFYPNGGTHQPGCPTYQEDDNCSHARSNLYFIESVNSKKFLASSCLSWEKYFHGKCANQEKIVFGEDVSNSSRGVYYFSTNSESPFALGR